MSDGLTVKVESCATTRSTTNAVIERQKSSKKRTKRKARDIKEIKVGESEAPKKKSHNKEIGRRGENAAVSFLTHQKYEILERNWKCPAGEADIIARDGETLVFVEVKTRTNLESGLPSESVSNSKRRRYEKIAGWYLQDFPDVDIPLRFDIVAILVVAENRALVRHYINAFGGSFK